MDQWYYLDGSETRGPVPGAQIAHLIRAGSLHPATQVAQAGWQTWSPASVALSNLLGAAPQPSQGAAAAPTYAIRVQCVGGPDAGKAYMISAPEVSLGRASGLGAQDPHIAENHVVLSWQNNVLFFRTLTPSKLRVAGVEVTQGTLSNGQQFQMGLSTWQVGTAPVELTNLLSNLGSRLNKLTSTDKLEGFSLTEFFSEVFKGRKPGEIDEYFAMGTAKTTPPLEEITTGWPRPWFFMRVLLFLALTYIVFYELYDFFGQASIRGLPGMVMVGCMIVPLALVFLFWELNTPRNISFPMVLILVCLGGAASLFVSFIGFEISNLGWLKASEAGIIEETGKLLAVLIVARNVRYKYMLNGLVFGAAIGAGFQLFENAGYVMMDGFFEGFVNRELSTLEQFIKVVGDKSAENVKYFIASYVALDSGDGDTIKQLVDRFGRDLTFWFPRSIATAYDSMLAILRGRSWDGAFTHAAWTSISACAMWRVKGADKFRISMLFDPLFLRVFCIPVVLHMIWNSPFLRFEGMLRYIKPLGLGFIAWYVIFTLVQQGLKQIRDMQLSQAQNEYQRTQEIITTTGRFRAQQQLG